MVIQMVARQVGESRRCQGQPVQPVLVQPVRRRLQRHHPDPVTRQPGQRLRQLDRAGCGQAPCDLAGYAGPSIGLHAQRTDTGRAVPGCGGNLTQEANGARLAVGARDSDDRARRRPGLQCGELGQRAAGLGGSDDRHGRHAGWPDQPRSGEHRHRPARHGLRHVRIVSGHAGKHHTGLHAAAIGFQSVKIRHRRGGRQAKGGQHASGPQRRNRVPSRAWRVARPGATRPPQTPDRDRAATASPARPAWQLPSVSPASSPAWVRCAQ